MLRLSQQDRSTVRPPQHLEGSQNDLQLPELYSELPASVYAASGALGEKSQKVRWVKALLFNFYLLFVFIRRGNNL